LIKNDKENMYGRAGLSLLRTKILNEIFILLHSNISKMLPHLNIRLNMI